MAPTFLQIGRTAVALHLPRYKALQRLIRDRWRPWLVRSPKTRVSIRIEAEKAPRAAINELLQSSPRRYNSVFQTIGSLAAVKAHRGQLIGKVLSERRLTAAQFYYGAIELVLLGLMRQLNLFSLHGSGVAKSDGAIISLGDSGAGKSTSAAFFMLEGFSPIADDDVIIHFDERIPKALGAEKGIFVCSPALERFKEFSGLKCLGIRLRGGRAKRLLSPGNPPSRSQGLGAPAVKKVLFPVVSRRLKSSAKKLNYKQAMLHFLAQKPADWPEYLGSSEAARQTFQLYDALSRKGDCYRVILGRDQAGVRRIIHRLANSG